MTEATDLNFREINPPERERKYIFPDAQEISFKNVSGICVRPSGNHRLNLASGKKAIVKGDWRAIIFDMDEWTF